MGPDDSNESRHSLPMGVGNDKRVDRKNKACSDCSVNVFWDPSGRNMLTALEHGCRNLFPDKFAICSQDQNVLEIANAQRHSFCKSRNCAQT